VFLKRQIVTVSNEQVTEEERATIVQKACPGQGACGGMYTANTMATAIEALGMYASPSHI